MMKELVRIESVLLLLFFQVVILITLLTGVWSIFLPSNLWGLLALFVLNLISCWIFWELIAGFDRVDDSENDDHPDAPISSNKPTTYPPGSGTSGNGRSGILSTPVPPPEAARKLWERWCRASGSQSPGTLGSKWLERVDALVNKGQRATDEERNRSEWDWFELVYDELWKKVNSERRATEAMSIFAETASQLGYSLITASPGEVYSSERHRDVGGVSGRTMVVSRMLLPGLQDKGHIRSRALVIFES